MMLRGGGGDDGGSHGDGDGGGSHGDGDGDDGGSHGDGDDGSGDGNGNGGEEAREQSYRSWWCVQKSEGESIGGPMRVVEEGVVR